MDTVKTCMQGDVERKHYKGIGKTFGAIMAMSVASNTSVNITEPAKVLTRKETIYRTASALYGGAHWRALRGIVTLQISKHTHKKQQ